jgi:hypothetical protein
MFLQSIQYYTLYCNGCFDLKCNAVSNIETLDHSNVSTSRVENKILWSFIQMVIIVRIIHL